MNKGEIFRGAYRDVSYEIYFNGTERMWYADVHYPSVNGNAEYTETSVSKEKGNAINMAVMNIDYFWETNMKEEENNKRYFDDIIAGLEQALDYKEYGARAGNGN